MEKIGPCRLTSSSQQSLYTALIRAVTGQQLHNAAAERIFARLCSLSPSENLTPPSPEKLLLFSDTELRTCGLSFAKMNTLREIAKSRQEGIIPSLEEAQKHDDEALISQLTTIKGVGRWTVEMMLIFTLHRPDIFPAGDFGVQEGWRRLHSMPERLSPKKLRLATLSFSPSRSILTWYCWQAKALLPAIPHTKHPKTL